MVYLVPYEADYQCPKGHKFVAKSDPGAVDEQARCPQCYEEWIVANVPMGAQISPPRVREETWRSL